MANYGKYILLVAIAAILAVAFVPAQHSEGSENANAGPSITQFNFDSKQEGTGWVWENHILTLDNADIDKIEFYIDHMESVNDDSTITINVNGKCSVGYIDISYSADVTISGDSLETSSIFCLNGLTINNMSYLSGKNFGDFFICSNDGSVTINGCKNVEIDMGVGVPMYTKFCFLMENYKINDVRKLTITDSHIKITNIDNKDTFAFGQESFFEITVPGLTMEEYDGNYLINFENTGEFIYDTSPIQEDDNLPIYIGIGLLVIVVVASGIVIAFKS